MIFLETNLSWKEEKAICDIVLYNTLGEYKSKYTKLVNKSKDSFNSRPIDYYKMMLEDEISLAKFESDVENLKLSFFNNGEYALWNAFGYIHDYCEKTLKTRYHLTGNYLTEAVEQKTADVIYRLNLDVWDPNEYPDLRSLVHKAYEFHVNRGKNDLDLEVLKSDLSINSEDDSLFSLANIDVRNENLRTTSKLCDPEFYSIAMDSIYEASYILFSDMSGGKSNLRELYFSIINYLQNEDILSIKSTLDEKNIYGDITIDSRVSNPILAMYADKGNNKWGHLLYIDSDYRNIQPGNRTRIMEIVRVGNSIIDKIYELLSDPELMKENKAFYIPQLTRKLRDSMRFNGEFLGDLGTRIREINVWKILIGIDYANQIDEVLKSTGHRIGAFPSSELRQKTYKRFFNLKELLDYYEVHENLSNIIKSEYGYGLGKSEVCYKDITQKNKSSRLTEIDILKKSLKSKLRIPFEVVSPRNKKYTVKHQKDSLVYTKLIENSIEYLKDTLFEEEKLSKYDISFILKLVFYLTELSSCFFKGNNYRFSLRSDTALSRLIKPEDGQYLEILDDLLQLSKKKPRSLDLDIVELVGDIHRNVDTPESVVHYIDNANMKIQEYLADISSMLGLDSFSVEPLICNINTAVNMLTFSALKTELKTMTKQVLDFAGLDKTQKPVKSLIPLIESCEKMINNTLIRIIYKGGGIGKYIKNRVLPVICKDSSKVPAIYIQEGQSVSEVVEVLFDNLANNIRYMYQCNEEINYSDHNLQISENTARDEIIDIDNKFANYMSSNINDALCLVEDETLFLYVIENHMNVLGKNGFPIIRDTNKKGVYWVYSAFCLKARMPGCIIEPMTEDDLKYIRDKLES